MAINLLFLLHSVETRSKDGIVKGKYGFVDANGQLKVTEYTAGEKSSDEPERDENDETTESEEEGGDFKRPRPAINYRPQPLSARPQPLPVRQQAYQPQQETEASRPVISATPAPYRIGARAVAFDQSPAAQTTEAKVSRAPPTTEDDFKESSEDESGGEFSRRQSQSSEDPLNGQFFRQSVRPGGQGQGGRFPSSGPGISAAGRPISAPFPTSGPGAYAPQQQYAGGFPSQGGPQYYQGQGGGPQGFGPQGFEAGAPQFAGPGGPGGFPPQFSGAPQDYNGLGGGFPQGGPSPQGFRRLQGAPQDFTSIGRPQVGGAPQGQGRPFQGIQNLGGFGDFGGFNRQSPNQGKGQSGSSQIPASEQYIPSVELDGYSEDLDQDGYPDDPPKDGSFPTKATPTGGSPTYRPIALGPQGLGGVQQSNRGQSGAGGPPPGQIILQLGGPQGAQGGTIGGGRFPGVPGGIQQQPQGPSGQQFGGLPPHYTPQQSFGFPQGGPQGFPQGGPQGFPQGFQGFDGQGFEGSQGFPQQFSGSPQQFSGSPQQFSQGAGGTQQRGQFSPTGPSAVQGEGFPFDFNPFGDFQGVPQGSQGFPGGAQGFPQGAQGFPQGAFPIQQGSYPGVQNFGGFPGGPQGNPQGFPIGPNGGNAGVSRFTQGGPQGSPGAQSFISGGAFPGQASPTPGSSSSESKKP